MRRDPASTRRIAREAVAVYNFTNSRPPRLRTARQAELIRQRALLAARCHDRYASDGVDGGNARPWLVGVFDTVASLANPAAIALLACVGLLAIAMLALASVWLPGTYLQWVAELAAAVGTVAVAANLLTRLKVAFGLPGTPWWRTLHLATARMKMYDTELDEQVCFARHALSIDEARASFQRVPWGVPGQRRDGQPVWFEQKWFAGNHSDIGGSYPENESRLSDIALGWMIAAAAECGLEHDPAALRPWPDARGMQHDKTRTGVFRLTRRKSRDLRLDAPLHHSVIERFEADTVVQYDREAPYRPDNLRHHELTARFFDARDK